MVEIDGWPKMEAKLELMPTLFSITLYSVREFGLKCHSIANKDKIVMTIQTLKVVSLLNTIV